MQIFFPCFHKLGILLAVSLHKSIGLLIDTVNLIKNHPFHRIINKKVKFYGC